MSEEKDLNITFSGCGFLGMYHLGVVSCLKDNAPAFLKRVKCFGGTSAGSFAATALVMDLNIQEILEFALRLAKRANSLTLGPLHPQFRLVQTVKKSFERNLPKNAHEIASGRLHISLTRVSDLKNVIVSEYHSKEDLIEALLATSHVPFYSSILPAKFRGVYYVDGGITDNLPQHFKEGETITVSPFSGESDICPQDGSPNPAYFDLRNTSVQFTLQNLYRCSRAFFPPEVDVLCDMCKQGYRDTMRFLQIHYPETLLKDAPKKRLLSMFMPSEFRRQDDSILTSHLTGSACHSRSSSLSSLYSTCSNAEADVFSSEQDENEEENVDDVLEGESRLSMMLDRTHQAIIETELWSCYFIRKAMWVFRMAAIPCVLSIHQITNIAHTIVEYLPVIEKTGIEFMDQLLAMVYVMINTYKDKHQVHHRRYAIMATGTQQKPLTISQARIQEVSAEFIQKWRRQEHTLHQPRADSPCESSSESAPENSDDIEVLHDDSYNSNQSDYDMCDQSLYMSFSMVRKHTTSDNQLDMTLGQWESEGGACHPPPPPSGSPLRLRSASDDYIVLDGYETDIESMCSETGEELVTTV